MKNKLKIKDINFKGENTDKTAKKVLGKPFQKGDDPRRNLEGRPPGVKNFTTLFEEAVKKIAKKKEIDPDSVEVDLIIKAIARAKGGNYRYYKDIFDRICGQPKQSTDITTGGKPLIIEISETISKKHDTNPRTESDSE